VSLRISSLSPFLWSYIKDLIPQNQNILVCKDLIGEALKCTCHVARVRSIAYAAGFCAYYARMIEKIGVFEVVKESISGKGKALHKILALASQSLFSKYSLTDIMKNKEVIKQVIDEAVDALDIEKGVMIKGGYRVVNPIITDSYVMMSQLLEALSRLYSKKLVGAKLFPLVEQEFIDFDDHMYGTPDLILEDLDRGKAVVVEWKSYISEGSKWSDVDIAQVVAYSIMEARRLGIRGLGDVFEAILGTDRDTVKEIAKIINRWKRRAMTSEKADELIVKFVEKAKRDVELKLRVIPIIITSSENFPPHPLMYKNDIAINYARRLLKLYETLRRVIIAADHLTLQLTNAEKLLAEIRRQKWDEVRKSLDCCKTKEGFYAFNYTPCRFLRCGKPIEQGKWPCRSKRGKQICPFAGENGPCKFYFGHREKEEYDIVMWKLRYKVFEEKERCLLSYRAIDILFKKMGLTWIFDNSIGKSCKGFIIDIAGETAYVDREPTVTFYIRVLRGGGDLDKIRFDIADLNNVDVETEDEGIVIRRKLRDIEVEKGLVGVIKKGSVATYIITPQLSTPLLTVNSFLMVGDCDVEGEDIVYHLYNPSPFLNLIYELFKRYIRILKRYKCNAKLLLFEANTNLTLMELRAIDALHRFIALIKEKGEELAKQHGLPIQDIRKDIEILEKISQQPDKELMEDTPLYCMLLKLFEKRVKF
jgi:hypothetical protein